MPTNEDDAGQNAEIDEDRNRLAEADLLRFVLPSMRRPVRRRGSGLWFDPALNAIQSSAGGAFPVNGHERGRADAKLKP